jgi:hypothetical protein
MSRIITLSLLLLCSISLSAQTVKKEQRTLLTKRTATWCPYCGQWGWTMMKNMVNDNLTKSIIIGSHYSGDLNSDAADELDDILGGSGQPVFFANNTNLRVNSGNISAKRTEVKQLVDNNFATSPVVNAGIEVYEKSGDLEVKVKTEFFESTSGEFYIGVLILENEVKNYQASQGPDALHPYVLRESIMGVTGELITSGSVSAGETFSFSYDYSPNAKWNRDSLHFAAVIWEKNSGQFEFVNGISTNDIKVSTSTHSQDNVSNFTVRPSILSDISTIDLSMTETGAVVIKIYDLLGIEQSKVFDGVLPRGQHRFDLKRDQVGRNGLYLISMEVNGDVITKRLMVK